MKWRRDSAADQAGQATQADGAGAAAQAEKQPRHPTHRAIALHAHAGQTFELEIGAAWEFAAAKATGLTVVLRELPPDGSFDLVEINPAPRDYRTVTSPTPQGNMPHLRVAVRDPDTGRYRFIGDAWRTLTESKIARIHVRLRLGTKSLRMALFDAPTWKP